MRDDAALMITAIALIIAGSGIALGLLLYRLVVG
jgi:hypothetical protein